MKRLKIQLGFLIIALVGLSAVYGFSRAAGQGVGDNVVVSQVAEDDLLIAGRNLQIQSEVKGDVTAAGSDVTITGPVAGYLMVAGAKININGPVGNDLWAAGASVNISTPIADNATLAGRDVNLLALYVVALLLSGVFVAYLVGGWILDRLKRPQSTPYLRMAVGAVAVGACMSLPWIGWLAQLLALLIGFGAIVLDQRDFALRMRAQGLA
jgi:hypothetical protein